MLQRTSIIAASIRKLTKPKIEKNFKNLFFEYQLLSNILLQTLILLPGVINSIKRPFPSQRKCCDRITRLTKPAAVAAAAHEHKRIACIAAGRINRGREGGRVSGGRTGN